MKSKRKPPYELEPPDLKQCQAERPNGQSFMTLGGGAKLVRCTSAPIVIATEIMPDEWGRNGSMSLCGHCMEVIQRQLSGHCTFAEVTS